MKKFGFTLAEILIVLVLIAVLATILLPVAFKASPDENVLKFKKANATLATVIHELVSSDDYYQDGDLGVMKNGNLVNSPKYFCETIAQVLNTKSVNCSTKSVYDGHNGYRVDIRESFDGKNAPAIMDKLCKTHAKEVGPEITLLDNVVFYQANPAAHFGSDWGKTVSDMASNSNGEYEYSQDELNSKTGTRVFGSKTHVDENGFDAIYKVFCIDVDAIPKSATSSDCVNECPFGYGIRADGKILPGQRADEWINKKIQKEN